MKNILITGCSSGLGREAAIALANRGHFVYATTHTKEQANKLNILNRKWHLPLYSFKLDVTSQNDRKKVDIINIDVLINNAAIGDSGSVCEIDVNKYRSVFETNVFCTIELTQRVLNNMINKKEGRIIFLSSLSGKSPIPFLSPYCATKFALEAIGESLNKELQVLKDIHIPVILIEPGAYATGFNEKNISKQFPLMHIKSYFKNYVKKLQLKQYAYFKLIESTNINSIIKEYIEAVEDENPKERYLAPSIQSKYIKLKITLSKLIYS
ncbi:SDR family NAD(P)-dependent oxidoreductase [Clostridium uliginosum]|uniref:Short-chain dehydrogenase n=1 Tax=Clostridium uliginosum TaxID=119641 RepID=A0A1I1RLP1_9CLOT|nr:SDR family NAD(P)-dependent oxidoreductase [Clostridium uliginosum]SFD35194.1 Short-chain dehydrogenase [Clostridium uliginosum]